MSDLMSIGIQGLMTFQAALTVTGQNFENVNTPFYSRRQIDLKELYQGGVELADVQRVYDGYASKNLVHANTQLAMSDMYMSQLTQISSFLGDDKNNVSTYLNASLTALRDLNSNAGLTPNRNLYLQQLGILAGRFNAVGQQLNQQQANINSSLTTLTNKVSELCKNLAGINQQIASSAGVENDSLLDAREKQLQELAQYVDVTTTIDNNGLMTVMLGNGTPLVVSTNSYPITTVNSPTDGNFLNLVIQGTSGGSIDVTNAIHGGQIAGLYKTQTALQTTINSLNRIAIGVMDQFNSQNKLGIDQNYNLGGNIFTDINAANFAMQRAIVNSTNTGTENVTVDIDNVNLLTTSDYKLVFDTATSYKLTKLSDNSVVSSGAIGTLPQQINVDGMKINLNGGTIVAGDSIKISPTRAMAGNMQVEMRDPSLLALGWPVDVSKNSQGGQINVTDIIDTTTSAFSVPKQLSPPIKIVFTSPTTYDLLDADTNTTLESGITYDPNSDNSVFPTPGSYDPGYRISLSGNIASGDTFNINYTTNNTGDIRNGKAFETLYSKPIFEGNKGLTFNSAYNYFSSNLAVQTNAAQTAYQGDKIVFDKADFNYKQVSGVSLPEEWNNLHRQQEAFQASAQIIDVARNMFDTILGLGRR